LVSRPSFAIRARVEFEGPTTSSRKANGDARIVKLGVVGDDGRSMPGKLIRLRYAAICRVCAANLSKRESTWWDPATRTATCTNCPPPLPTEPSSASDLRWMEPATTAQRSAGASARNEYERRHQRRERQIEQRWGRLARAIKFLSDDPQSTKAWAKGSEGERRLAAHLLETVGARAILLHDLKVPGTRANIDHLAIAASGVWVIDTKRYTGKVERRDRGGLFKTDQRLYVAGRDRTRLIDGLGWQVRTVRDALRGADVPITAALCFVDAEWRLLSRPFELEGVWVTWPKKLSAMIAAPGPLASDEIGHVAGRLSR
jgi:hypothetical protein